MEHRGLERHRICQSLLFEDSQTKPKVSVVLQGGSMPRLLEKHLSEWKSLPGGPIILLETISHEGRSAGKFNRPEGSRGFLLDQVEKCMDMSLSDV